MVGSLRSFFSLQFKSLFSVTKRTNPDTYGPLDALEAKNLWHEMNSPKADRSVVRGVSGSKEDLVPAMPEIVVELPRRL